MNTTSWHRIRRILEAAIDCPPHHRDRLLDRACKGDAELRRHVTELLEQEAPGDGWLDSPVPGAVANLVEWSEVVGGSDRIGRYRVGDVIAVGGMGVVVQGFDDSANDARPVAIKILSRGVSTRRMLRAFKREQQLLDQLDHPNITRLLDSGVCADGRPYIVMEYVDGQPIDEFVRTSGLPIADRLSLFRTVCLAVHYAHQNLIVHRDLKPGNILVGAGGVVKLLDFGIAKLLHDQPRVMGTATETMMDAMTLQYCSPEQIRGEPISTATDIFSLGVILHEMIAGRPPYDLSGTSRYEAERVICESTPSSPSEAFRASHSDVRVSRGQAVDRIVAMAMQKEPRRRYASAEQLAEDVRRYLDGSTVMAYRAGRFERALTTIRKHRVAFGIAAASFTVVTALAVVSAMLARTATVARDRETKARQVSQKINGFMNDLLALAGPSQVGPSDAGLRVLEEASIIVGRELSDQPDIAAGVYHQIGSTYGSLRRRSEAIRNYRNALECYRRCAQPDKARLSDCLVALGSALAFRDDEEGLAFQREALALRRELYGDEHLRVAQGMHGVAFALTRCARPARYDEAEVLYRQALAMRERLGAGESGATAENLHAIAALMRHQNRLEASAEQYEKALAMSRRVLPALDTQLIDCIEDYAVCLRDLGRFDRAESLLRESLAMSAQAMGESSTVVTLAHLASVSQARGDRAGAWRHLHLALARFCRGVSPDPLGLAGERWRQLVTGFAQQPERPNSEAIRELLALAPVAYSPKCLSPSMYCSLLDQVAGLAADEGEYVLGERLSREAIRLLDVHDPSSKMMRMRYQRTLAESLIGRGQLDEARRILVEVDAALRATRGPEHRETRATADRLAGLDSTQAARIAPRS